MRDVSSWNTIRTPQPGGSDCARTAVSALTRSSSSVGLLFLLRAAWGRGTIPSEMFLPLAPRTAARIAQRARQQNANGLLPAGMFIGSERQPKVPGRSTGCGCSEGGREGAGDGDGGEIEGLASVLRPYHSPQSAGSAAVSKLELTGCDAAPPPPSQEYGSPAAPLSLEDYTFRPPLSLPSES